MKFLHSGHRHVLMCLSMLCVSCMSMYIRKKLYMHCLKTYCEPQYVLKAYILDQLQDTGISMNVSEPRNCLTSSRRWEKKDQKKKKEQRGFTTAVTKFKYLLQSGLQQPIACPHLFAPCRRTSQHASAGCFWSSNHQLNPADKVGKSGYNYFLMSAKHHYHMKDTVTNGFTLHWLMKTLVMQAVAY